MTVKLHKVTVYVVDTGNPDEDGLAQLQGDVSHNSKARIHYIKTVKFDREWSEDDPLNQTTTLNDRAMLDRLIDEQLNDTCSMTDGPASNAFPK